MTARHPVARGIAVAGGVVSTLWLAIRVPNWMRFGSIDPIQVFLDSPYVIIATACWLAVIWGVKRAGVASLLGILCGILLGGLAAILGFFGPMLLMPHSNQGPLFGPFIAGPLAFVIGDVAGAIYTAWRPPYQPRM